MAPPIYGQKFHGTIARDLRRMVFGQDILQPVCFTHGGAVGSGTGLSDGVATQATFRRSYMSLKNNAINDLQFVFANWFTIFDDLGEWSNPDTITIQAVLEYPLNTFYNITFGNGSVNSLSLLSGAQVMSDPVPIQIPANTRFYVRTYVSVASGKKWPTYGGALTGLGDSFLTGVNSLTTASIANTFGYVYEPVQILGKVNKNLPNVLIIGDSIAYGLGDSNGSLGEVGWINRAISNTYGTTKLCKSSESLNQFINSINARSRRRLALLRNAPYTHAMIVEGKNDLTQSRTSTQVIADLQTLVNFIADAGIAPIVSTITPHTTSTGGQWLNAADQTAANGTFNTTHRQAVNAAILAGLTNAMGSYDQASIVCDNGAIDKWKTDGTTNKLYTNDGLHPNAAGNVLIAADFATKWTKMIF